MKFQPFSLPLLPQRLRHLHRQMHGADDNNLQTTKARATATARTKPTRRAVLLVGYYVASHKTREQKETVCDAARQTTQAGRWFDQIYFEFGAACLGFLFFFFSPSSPSALPTTTHNRLLASPKPELLGTGAGGWRSSSERHRWQGSLTNAL